MLAAEISSLRTILIRRVINARIVRYESGDAFRLNSVDRPIIDGIEGWQARGADDEG